MNLLALEPADVLAGIIGLGLILFLAAGLVYEVVLVARRWFKR